MVRILVKDKLKVLSALLQYCCNEEESSELQNTEMKAWSEIFLTCQPKNEKPLPYTIMLVNS